MTEDEQMLFDELVRQRDAAIKLLEAALIRQRKEDEQQRDEGRAEGGD